MATGQSNGKVPRALLMFGAVAALPLWASAALALWPGAPLPAIQATAISITYGATMLAFAGALRWGLMLGSQDIGHAQRDGAAAIVSLFLSFAAILLPPIIALALLIAGFLAMAMWDQTRDEAAYGPPELFRLRMILTAMAVSGLLVVLARLVLAGER